MGLLQSTATATIANGEALSGAIFVGGKVPCAIQMPAAWTAADLTFQVSDDGTTWTELLANDGTAVTVSAPAAGARINLYASDFQSSYYFKARSGTAAIPVNQAAARALVLVTRKFYPER